MIIVKRFTSFEDAKKQWQEFEDTMFHYPFQTFWYQKLFAETFCKQQDIYLLGIYEQERLLAIGGFEKVDDTLLFLGMKKILGGQEVTDYGDLLYNSALPDKKVSEIWTAIIGYAQQQQISRVQLDYLREDSKTYMIVHSNPATVENQEVAPYITTPSSWEQYLESLERKQRHELKRKIKRFEEQKVFHFCSNETIQNDFEIFVQLHRASDEAKEKFMSEDMKKFFWNIVSAEKNDYRTDFCFLEMDNKPVAAIMSFVGQGKALLYNSGIDPEYKYFSVSLILHAYLVKKSIEKNLQIHDFLRGNERYKYDLGAQDMQLYKITISNGGSLLPMQRRIDRKSTRL